MLSQNTINVIKSTIPVLEVHGEAITRHFYETMSKHHPELLNIFNHANQKQGRQQAALANMVYTAAQHIDNLPLSCLPYGKLPINIAVSGLFQSNMELWALIYFKRSKMYLEMPPPTKL